MTYKIIKFDENTGMATVKFDNSNSPVAIKLPIQNSKFLIGRELDFYISGFKPSEAIYENVSGIENIAEIHALVQEESVESPTPGEIGGMARQRRDSLLLRSDYTQLPDSPLSADMRIKYAEYRQQLRDITEQAGFPSNVIWPTSPDVFVTPVVTIGSDTPPAV